MITFNEHSIDCYIIGLTVEVRLAVDAVDDPYIYIYIHIHYVHISLSLSIYIYIYTYVYLHIHIYVHPHPLLLLAVQGREEDLFLRSSFIELF